MRKLPLGNHIWVVIICGYGNHLCNIKFVTHGLWPLVIISILSLVITTTTRNDNPYTFSKSGITSQYNNAVNVVS